MEMLPCPGCGLLCFCGVHVLHSKRHGWAAAPLWCWLCPPHSLRVCVCVCVRACVRAILTKLHPRSPLHLQLFTELAKAYNDAAEPDSPLPRQQPTSLLASMLRLMDALLPVVGGRAALWCWHSYPLPL